MLWVGGSDNRDDFSGPRAAVILKGVLKSSTP